MTTVLVLRKNKEQIFKMEEWKYNHKNLSHLLTT